MTQDDSDIAVQQLIAKALLGVSEPDLRGLIAAAVEQAIKTYDVQRIVSHVMTPLAEKAIREYADTPEGKLAIAEAAKNAFVASLGRIRVEIPNARW